MIGTLIIKPQRYEVNGHAPLTYGIFLQTDESFQGIECWQDCSDVFVAYSRTLEGAERAIREIENGKGNLWSL